MNVRLVHPPEFQLMPEIVERAKEEAHRAHGSFEMSNDFDEGIRGTDIVYAKSWGAMTTTTDEAEGRRHRRQLAHQGPPAPSRSARSWRRRRPSAAVKQTADRWCSTRGRAGSGSCPRRNHCA